MEAELHSRLTQTLLQPISVNSEVAKPLFPISYYLCPTRPNLTLDTELVLPEVFIVSLTCNGRRRRRGGRLLLLRGCRRRRHRQVGIARLLRGCRRRGRQWEPNLGLHRPLFFPTIILGSKTPQMETLRLSSSSSRPQSWLL